jgi:hypothetical protein
MYYIKFNEINKLTAILTVLAKKNLEIVICETN